MENKKCLPCFTYVSTGFCEYRGRCQYVHDIRITKKQCKTELRRIRTDRPINCFIQNDKVFYWAPDGRDENYYDPPEFFDMRSYHIWKSFLKIME